MDFARIWQQYGPAVAIIAILIVPFAGKLWDAAIRVVEKRLNHVNRQSEAEFQIEQKREQEWIAEFKTLLVDYREQRNLAIKRAEKAEAELREVHRLYQERTDNLMTQYINIIKTKERQDAAIIEALRDLADLNRRLLERLERLELCPIQQGQPTSCK